MNDACYTDREMVKGVGQLRRKFPSIDAKIGAMVDDMAKLMGERKPDAVTGWTEARPARQDSIIGEWVAYLHVRLGNLDQWRIPVIPDEHNPEPTKLVRPEDEPWVFKTMQEADRAANSYLPGLLEYARKEYDKENGK